MAHCSNRCFLKYWELETQVCPFKFASMGKTIWGKNWKKESFSYYDWKKPLHKKSYVFPYSRICYICNAACCDKAQNRRNDVQATRGSKQNHLEARIQVREALELCERCGTAEFGDTIRIGIFDLIKLVRPNFVFCRNLKLTRIDQVPKMGLEDLFAQFGGYLGLLTGVSVITLLEFLEFIFTSITSFTGRFWKKETRNL